MTSAPSPFLHDTLTIILAGGVGQRLYPLTKDRAKPAVPFGGIYRILDFTLSNCILSGLRRIYVLTQYKSDSMGRHLQLGWNVLNYELGEFLLPVPPQHRISNNWYQGTADAIFQNIYLLQNERPRRVLILSGDHLYNFDYRKLLAFHDETNSELTVAAMEIPIDEGSRFGIIQVNNNLQMVGFQEKPRDPEPMPGKPNVCLGSMGVYVFNTDVLVRSVSHDAKERTDHDFGKNVIPSVMEKHRVMVFPYEGYWRDIGTLDSYFEANMDMLKTPPPLDLFDRSWPMRTFQPQLPPSRIHLGGSGSIESSLVSPGCQVQNAKLKNCLLSPRVSIGEHSVLENVVVFENTRIGSNCVLRNAIIDKHVVIPNHFHLGVDPERDRRHFTVSEKGIVAIPRGMVIEE